MLVKGSGFGPLFILPFFKVIGYTHYGHPFVQILESDEYVKEEKLSMCRVITDLYDQGKLNDTAMKTITQIEELTGIRGHKGNYIDQQEHNYFQDMLSELSIDGNEDTEDQQMLTNNKMQQLVKKELSEGGVFEYDSALLLKPATRRRIEPSLVEINAHQSKHSAYRIAQLLKVIMNNVIARKLSEVSVDFGIDGVRNLLGVLSDIKWQYRNYKHINDYAIPNSVRESDEFKKLCELLAGITYDCSHEITSYVFLKEPKVRYNLDVHYHLEEPTEEKCAEFVNRHRIADGVYQIGANRFDHAHAMRYVRKRYKLEIVDLFVRVDVEKESGFRVEFPGGNVHDEVWTRPTMESENPIPDSRLIIGHTKVLNLIEPQIDRVKLMFELEDVNDHLKILHAPGFINLDCGCGYDMTVKAMACLRLEDMKEFYT